MVDYVGTRQPLLDLLPAIAFLSLAMEQLGEEVLKDAANISRFRSERHRCKVDVCGVDRTTSIKQKKGGESERAISVRGLLVTAKMNRKRECEGAV